MRRYSLLASRPRRSYIFVVPLRIHDSFVYSYFSMAVRPSNDSTGYETLAYASMSATQGKQATHFNIASDDEIAGQHSAADNLFSPDGEASSTNERPDGTGSRPLAGLTTGASRNRSRSNRTNSKGVSSEEDVQAAKHVAGDQQKNNPAGKRPISSCDPRAPKGVTGYGNASTISNRN